MCQSVTVSLIGLSVLWIAVTVGCFEFVMNVFWKLFCVFLAFELELSTKIPHLTINCIQTINAMPSRKCCVGGCDSTSETHRLFNIPKNDRLRELWLSFLIPTNVELSGLSKEQLVSKLVCQNHFDRHQFDGAGNRIQHGYPSLFSPKEISHGIVLSASGK